MRDQLGGLRSSGEKGKDKAISVVAWEIHNIKDPNFKLKYRPYTKG